jgi:hypothetical protein
MTHEYKIIIVVIAIMLVYFLLATPVMMDDGFHYQGFAESLAKGKIDFASYYGFQGLSFFAVPVIWLTGSSISIIIASIIFSLLSIPLAYMTGRDYFDSRRAGYYSLILFLLTPYPYTTMFRGFQEAALLFFILLIIYASINKKIWTPIAWAIGGIVKPFALTLLPLLYRSDQYKDWSDRYKQIGMMLIALFIGGLYLGVSYYQTGHLVNNAAINSYQGNFDSGNPPPLNESFVLEAKGFLRVGANLLLSFRKIMISPLLIVVGAISLLLNKTLKLRKEIILAIFFNFLLVGSLTFSFSKYLLPMTTLFALAAIPYLMKNRLLMGLVFVESIFVFWPIWEYFGYNFWSNAWIYYIPFYLAIIIYVYAEYNTHSNS